MQSDGGEWKSTFVMVKPFLATYHESGKSYKKGFINLKLARVEPSSKSGKRFKVRFMQRICSVLEIVLCVSACMTEFAHSYE